MSSHKDHILTHFKNDENNFENMMHSGEFLMIFKVFGNVVKTTT